ncbi:MAG: hypothetical protein GF331_19460 [Chitinivibrionales bacterium]|nr:hypothetical protein [Chitinivibrionales bacterium]
MAIPPPEGTWIDEAMLRPTYSNTARLRHSAMTIVVYNNIADAAADGPSATGRQSKAAG